VRGLEYNRFGDIIKKNFHFFLCDAVVKNSKALKILGIFESYVPQRHRVRGLEYNRFGDIIKKNFHFFLCAAVVKNSKALKIQSIQVARALIF
jgi:hypothetical protein